MLYKSASWLQQSEVTHLLASNMAAGVHQDRGLNILTRSMVDPTDAGMEREGPGLMTSIGFQVPC